MRFEAEQYDNDVRFLGEFVEAIGVIKDRLFMLLVLRVESSHQNRGIGLCAVRRIALWCRGKGVRRIDVDDMTDRHRCAHNIYLKAGFQYMADTGPEMYASPRNIIKRTQEII